MTNGYGSTYAFDDEHRLTEIGNDLRFTYDARGNRVEAVRNGIVTRYIYDAGGNLLAEADGENRITRYYIYGRGLMAMTTPDERTYCYHYNATGSTIALTDDAGNIVNSYVYDPFGKITDRQEAMQQPFTFVGQYGVMTEPDGLYYMRARYYDPNAGRFISEDPLGLAGGDVNLYAYAGNNPVMMIDPWGRCQQEQSFWNNFTEGRYFGTGLGEQATQWYADKHIESKAWYYAVGGLLSSLWTPDTYLSTATTLASGLSFAASATSAGGPLAIPSISIGAQGNNYFRIIDTANRVGFRIDKPHVGHTAKGLINFIKGNLPHPHFWSW